MTLPIFVGYDIREHAAWLTCRESLYRPLRINVPQDVDIHVLNVRELRRVGVFTRPWRIDEKGQYWDDRDGRPFSTEFAHSRFLVPALAAEMGLTGWVLFCDCDFMFLDSPTDLLKDLDSSKAIYVVKHDFDRVVEGVKMDGMLQQKYHRKLWSSLTLWNLDHPQVKAYPSTALANHGRGGDLHGFTGFDDKDIGALPEAWNWIPGHSSGDIRPAAVHWSFGGPWLPEYADTSYAKEWQAIYDGVFQNYPVSQTLPLV